MLATALIVFREVLEAGLVVGIVLAATEGVRGRLPYIVGGIAGGVLGAALVAAFAGTIGAALEGAGQEAFNGTVMLIAAIMLGWHNLWMAQHGRQVSAEMKRVGRAVAEGRQSLAALALVVGIAVLREGSEVVLFLYGIAVGGDGWAAMLTGGLIGLGGGVLAAGALYRGLLAIPTRHLFAVTTTMLTLLAAGMAATAAGFFVQADLLPALGARLWDTSALLPEASLVGRALHALVGYTDRPAGVQVLAYVATLALLLGLSRMGAPASARATMAASAE